MDYLKDRVTIYQVAQAAGVSLATVSRVINKSDSVTPATRKKVEDTIEALGYKPSAVAQALATNRSTNIGIIIPSCNYVFIANMLAGITTVAKEKNYQLTMFTTSHSREEAMAMIEKVITAHVDGAIIFDDQLNQEDVDKIASYNVPTVVIDKKAAGEKVCDVRFSYDDALANLITHHYDQKNPSPMAFLHVHNAGRLLGRCEKTFIRTHDELGKDYRIVNCDDSYTHTYQQFFEYFKEEDNRRGYYVCYRDSIAAAVLNAALDSGLRVPEDVEILSLVGTKYANIFRPRLSAMHIDMQEVGKRAMYMLTDLLNQELIDKTARFEATFVAGGTTRK